jgi:quercetin dioxygenase-like cupin family protein
MMDILNWRDVSVEEVSPLQTRKVIHTNQATVVRIFSKKGATVPLHHHVHEQITMVISGCFRFEMDGKTLLLQTGDVLHVPSNVPHQGEAIEDCETLELFTPAREDWKKI